MALTTPDTQHRSTTAKPGLGRPLIGFPPVVNEVAARTVAVGVVGLSVAFVATGSPWFLVPLVYGFWARVLAGPRFSPLGLLATRLIVPCLSARAGLRARLVPGPPKRFAQGIGAALSTSGALLMVAGLPTAARVTVAAIAGAALAEASLGFCLGCVIFGRLMAAGIIPETVCEACNDLSLRSSATARA
jgi:hypothetical protein